MANPERDPFSWDYDPDYDSSVERDENGEEIEDDEE